MSEATIIKPNPIQSEQPRAAIADRMHEGGGVIKVNGKSFRKRK